MKFCSCTSCLSWSGMRWGGGERGVQAKLNLMFTLSMISSSRIYLTCPVCLFNRRSVPICLPSTLFYFIVCSTSPHFSGILQYSLFISGSRWSIKNQPYFLKNKIQHFILSTGVPSFSGTPQVAGKHFLTPGFQIMYLTTVFSKTSPTQRILGWNTLQTLHYAT